MYVILVFNMGFDQVYLAGSKWRPSTFISHLSRYQPITTKRNVETAQNYVHKLEQILRGSSLYI